MDVGETVRPITLILPHFMNLGMLAEQQKVWAAYPREVRERLHVVVVDDRSPKEQRPRPEHVTVHDLASFRIYHLKEKKRWNWLACRNLGAKVATTDWLILTDIDHVFPAQTLERLMCGPMQPNYAYRFCRVNATRCWPYDVADCPEYKPHNDTWVMARSLFFHDGVFGYDERLSGFYGTSGEFSDRVRATAAALVMLPDVIIRYPREVLPDASTPKGFYTRKNDPVNDAGLAKKKRGRAGIPNWKPLHGLIPSELIYDSTAVATEAVSA